MGAAPGYRPGVTVEQTVASHEEATLLARHPRLVDVGIALLCVPAVLAPGIGDGGAATPGLLAPLDGPGQLLALVACAVLLLRQRLPWGVLGVTVLLALVSLTRLPDAAQVTLPSLFATYTVASRSTLRTTVAVAVAVPSAVVGALLLAGLPAGEALQRGVLPWTVLAAALGIAARSQRLALDAARLRARQAESTRDEEAQRRVAEERLRIARDLHDVVAHQIAVVNVQAGVARHLLDGEPADTAGAREALGHVREASGAVMRELPAFLGVLRAGDETAPAPTAAEVEELIAAARRSGLDVRARVSGDPHRLDRGAALATYRVLQEALTNAARHGDGSADVEVAHGPGSTVVEVVNVVRPGAPAAGGGHGLVGMRERVATHGGTLEAGPDGDRWRVRAEIPVRA